VEAEQGVGLGEAEVQAGDADQHREQAIDLAEGAGDGAAEGTVRPHSAPSATRGRLQVLVVLGGQHLNRVRARRAEVGRVLHPNPCCA
jgi:hypothetical protein